MMPALHPYPYPNPNPNPNPNQDLPWLLPAGAPISFTVLDAADAYAPVKNALADAAKKVRVCVCVCMPL